MKLHIVFLMPDPAIPDEVVTLGVFSTSALAAAECRDRRYFVATVDLDVCLSHDTIDDRMEIWRGRCSDPDPELQARQMALMAQAKAQPRCKCCGGVKPEGSAACAIN